MAYKLFYLSKELSRIKPTQKAIYTKRYTLMLISCDEKRKVIYITPDGDFVAEEVEAMRRQLQEYMRHGMETLVLDLARVRIDSFGLNTIIVLYNLICKCDGEIIIENASRELKKLFREMRIAGRLTISQTGWPS
jgi:anti-anti-sigma factor